MWISFVVLVAGTLRQHSHREVTQRLETPRCGTQLCLADWWSSPLPSRGRWVPTCAWLLGGPRRSRAAGGGYPTVLG